LTQVRAWLNGLVTYGVLMPAVAATMLTGRYAGRTGLRELYVRLRLWRVGRWWLPVLLIQPCVLVIAAAGRSRMARTGAPCAPGAGRCGCRRRCPGPGDCDLASAVLGSSGSVGGLRGRVPGPRPVTGGTGAFALLTAVECAVSFAVLSRLESPETQPAGSVKQRQGDGTDSGTTARDA
jgi:hypothetical protein